MAGYIGSKTSVVSSGAEHKTVFTATSGQTSFTGLSYTPTKVHVFQNGVRLVDGTDYTASNGTSITLTVGAATDDQVVVVSYATFQTSDTVLASTGGTFNGAVAIDADDAIVLTMNRGTSDGTIIAFQKDGVDIGIMGTVGGKFYLGSFSGSDAFLKFESNILSPSDNAGVARNNAIDLGKSVSAFKDLYLGGGVYLGGTGAANKLDDYEEGTWTPTAQGTSSITNTVGHYTKVGNTVFFYWYSGAMTMSSAALAVIGGLPFTVASGAPSYSAILATHNNYAPNSNGGYVTPGTTSIDLIITNNLTRDTTPSSGTKYLMISGHYRVA